MEARKSRFAVSAASFRNRAPRKGRNPKTGEKVDVPPKKIPYFKMGKELKALLNGAAGLDEATSPAQDS